MVWDKNDYVLEAQKNFSDPSVYQDVSNSENILLKLSEASSKIFSSLRRKGFVTEKHLKYFTYEYKRQRILVNFTYFPKFISDFLMSTGDL